MANELDNLLELKMELSLGNKDLNNTTDDLISSSSINFKTQSPKNKNTDNILSSKIFQRNENVNDINKIKELYYIKKNLIEENELLLKTLNMFTPDTITEKNKIVCGCNGDIQRRNRVLD